MEDEKMKCISCNEEREVLMSVMTRNDSIFGYNKGVCQDCIKGKDINKVCEEYEIRKTEESIEQAEQSLKDMKEHLKKFRKEVNDDE